MTAPKLPSRAGQDFDFELELDDLDEETLQRLLEEDPALDEALAAVESDETPRARPATAAKVDAVRPQLPPMVEPHAGKTDDPFAHMSDGDVADDDAPFVAAPSHDDLADFDYVGDAPQETDVEDAEIEAEVAAAPVFRPVPRVNIHVFCGTDSLVALVQQAAADRRLAKAHLTIQSGDIQTAVDVYQTEPTPNLIIVDAGKSGKALLAGLDALALVCDPSTRVIVVGEINDIRLYRELMNRGISEYLIRPRAPIQIINSISALYSDPQAARIGRTLAFVGTRGGSGSSTLAHNVAWTLAEEFGSDTVLVDLDLPFGTAGLDFEQDPSQGLAEALAAPDRLDEVLLDRLLQKCTDRLSLFAAPNALDRDYDLPAESFEQVIDLLRNAAPSIVIDLPHIWTGWSRSIIQSADEIVLCATPDLPSFRNAKNLVEALRAARVNDAPPTLVLTQVGVPKRPEVPVQQFIDALGLQPKAIVPWDPVLFGNSATNAQTLIQAGPKSKIATEVRRIARHLLGRQEVVVPSKGLKIKSLFAKRA